MNIKTVFKRLIFPDTYSEAAYIDALKKNTMLTSGRGVVYGAQTGLILTFKDRICCILEIM